MPTAFSCAARTWQVPTLAVLSACITAATRRDLQGPGSQFSASEGRAPARLVVSATWVSISRKAGVAEDSSLGYLERRGTKIEHA